MTPPTIAPPPPQEAPPEQQPPVLSVHAPLRRFGRRAPTGRPSPAAIAGSVAVHLALLGLVVAFVRIGPRLLDRDEPTTETVEYFDLAFPQADEGTQVAAGGPADAVQFPPAAPAAAPPAAGEQPERTDRAEAPGEALVFPSGAPTGLPQAGGAPAQGGSGTGGAGQPGGTGTGGSPLRPGIRDPRLFPTLRPVPAKPEQTPHEEYMGRLGSTLGEYNDSVAAERARASDALDWTLKDKDGNRWGASPGKIHLGKLTLPAPFGFAASPDASAEARRESGQRAEIDRQVADRERSNSFQSRVRATRERKDAERRLIRGES